MPSTVAFGPKKPLPVGEGLGWGSEAQPRVSLAGVAPPSPTLPRWGRGLRSEGLEDWVVFEPVLAVCGQGQGFGDAKHHAVGVLQNFVVPEADHTITVALDHPGAPLVSGTVGMLPAVNLDHQFQPAAGEIGDGVADLEFARELNAKLPCAQPRSQQLCRVGRFAAETLRNRRQSLGYHPDTPLKPPYPAGKGWGWGFRLSSKRRTPIPTLPQWGRALPALIGKTK